MNYKPAETGEQNFILQGPFLSHSYRPVYYANGLGSGVLFKVVTKYATDGYFYRLVFIPRFRERAQHISGMMRDQLENPADKAAF